MKRHLSKSSFALSTLALILAAPAQAEEAPGWYLGGAIGVSRMDPIRHDSPYTIDDKSDTGGQVYLGYRINDRYSAEGFYADLGEAGLSQNESLGYTIGGISALYHMRSGETLRPYLRLGVGRMDNETDVPFNRDNDNHIHYGLGADYNVTKRLAVRTEATLYDQDAQMVSVGLRYSLAPQKAATPPPTPVPVPVPTPEPDTDKDGVIDKHDKCPETPFGRKVDEQGCHLQGSLGVIYFDTDSSAIRPDAKITIDKIADKLKNAPNTPAVLEGHADYRGSKQYNLGLSDRRNKSVKQMLIQQGIEADRLSDEFFGEDSPASQGKSRDALQLNRRVEVFAK